MTKQSDTKQKKKLVMKSSEREVYEQEKYYEIVVEDVSGIVQKEGVLKEMFEALCDGSLRKFVASKFDSTIFETNVRVKTRGHSIYAQVRIKERNWLGKLKSVFRERKRINWVWAAVSKIESLDMWLYKETA